MDNRKFRVLLIVAALILTALVIKHKQIKRPAGSHTQFKAVAGANH